MEIITIGDCTLIHGDAMEYMKANPEIADCIVSDVPYRLTSGGPSGLMRGAFDPKKYNNNGQIVTCNLKWTDFMPLFYSSLKKRGHCYTMANNRNVRRMLNAAHGAKFRFHNLLFWDKKTCTPNRWYMKHVEFTGFFFKGHAFAINDCSSRQGVAIPHRDETEHATEKPVLLMMEYIRNSTQPGQTVFDPFAGTFTTGVAAAKLGRKFIGVEIEKQWFDIGVQRIKDAYKNNTQAPLL